MRMRVNVYLYLWCLATSVIRFRRVFSFFFFFQTQNSSNSFQSHAVSMDFYCILSYQNRFWSQSQFSQCVVLVCAWESTWFWLHHTEIYSTDEHRRSKKKRINYRNWNDRKSMERKKRNEQMKQKKTTKES